MATACRAVPQRRKVRCGLAHMMIAPHAASAADLRAATHSYDAGTGEAHNVLLVG